MFRFEVRLGDGIGVVFDHECGRVFLVVRLVEPIEQFVDVLHGGPLVPLCAEQLDGFVHGGPRVPAEVRCREVTGRLAGSLQRGVRATLAVVPRRRDSAGPVGDGVSSS